MTMTSQPVQAQARLGLSQEARAIIRLALAEDVGRGDVTTEATTPDPNAVACAELLQKAPGVMCGLPVVEAVLPSSTRACG